MAKLIRQCDYWHAAMDEEEYRRLFGKLQQNIDKHRDWIQITCTHQPRCVKPDWQTMRWLNQRLAEELKG